MKLAVLVYGEYRQFDLAVKTWKFLDELDCDVYISTWNTSYEECIKDGSKYELKVDEDMYKTYVPNAKIDLLDEKDYLYLDEMDSKKLNNTSKMYFHWKNLSKMMKDSNVQYDSVIILRTDLYLNMNINPNKLFEFNQENTLYAFETVILGGPNMFRVDDVYFQSNYETMIKFLDNISLENTWHTDLANHIIKLGLWVNTPIGKGEFNSVICRPNCRGVEDLSFQKVHELCNEWYNDCVKWGRLRNKPI